MDGGNGKYKWVGTRPIRPDGVDKVTGRANFGADFAAAGMLTGKVLRSPHAHARILSIDTSKAAALKGVKAVVTAADFPEQESVWVAAGEVQINYRDLSANAMARDKALYDGHAVAAVAATSTAIANQALALIEVEYEILPHVIDVVEAMAPDAPILHDGMITEGVEPRPETASNVFKRVEFPLGDVEAGFAEAEVVVEREFTTQPVHQGYIEPQAVVANVSEDGQCQIWCTTQGQFMIRAFCAQVVGMDISQIRVTPSEIGGGFGGKTVTFAEPVAVALSRKAGRPVKIVMSRDEVFRGTGPTAGSASKVRIGAMKDGRIVAGEAILKLQAGAFPGSPVGPAAMCAFAPYDIPNVRAVAYDVVVNRPKCTAYRAPGSPLSCFAVESVLNDLAKKLGMDPLALRQKNAAREGTQAAYGPKFGVIGYIETLDAAQAHPHYAAPLGPNQGRGVASGFWFNIGGDSSAAVNINEDGTAVLVSGNPDIGGSRASLAMMAAEELGIDMTRIKPIIGDTSSIGYSFLTGGSRVTYATGMAVVEAAQAVVLELRGRAAKIWDIPVDAVEWKDGEARPAGANAGDFEPLSLAEIASTSTKTGGPIASSRSLNAKGAGPSFGTHICDVEVDPETGRVTVLRYTTIQDVGRAIHPAYVEGQMQGGAAQGVGWALNEEYVYGADGRLQNPGFLDYRMPVASDLPMIDTVMIEVPNPRHPYGARGVGEVPICPPLAAVASAVENATGVQFSDLPLSPPRILAAIDNGG